jgi:hypothetical protein
MVSAGKPYEEGYVLLTSLYQSAPFLLKIFTFCYKARYLTEVVNCTKSPSSVSFPWLECWCFSLSFQTDGHWKISDWRVGHSEGDIWCQFYETFSSPLVLEIECAYIQGDQNFGGKIAQCLKVAQASAELKMPKYLPPTHFWNLKIPTTDNVLKLLIWVRI